MRLTIFNGSPRGRGSNTSVFLEQFLSGFEARAGNSHELFYLNRPRDMERFVQAFADTEHVLLAFPLYADAMPGLVKEFIEALEPFCGREGNPDIGFLVQSGFPEAFRMRPVERHLQKLAARLGCRYVGTIVKGGGEGARVRPKAYRKAFEGFRQLGECYGETGQFDQDLLHRLAQPERFSKVLGILLQLMSKTKLGTSYFDVQLKENGAYERRFARPYAE